MSHPAKPAETAPSSGVPQIQYTSINQAPACGGSEIVVIGRNLIKGTTRLCVQEMTDISGRERIIWQETVHLLPSFFTQVHLVAKIPAYNNLGIQEAVPVALVLKNSKKCSQPFPFLYLPASCKPRATSEPTTAPPPRLQRHVSVQCVLTDPNPHFPPLPPSLPLPFIPTPPLPRELRPYISETDLQSLDSMDVDTQSHPGGLQSPPFAYPTPTSSRSLYTSHSDSELETRKTLFPLSPHDTAFLNACGLDFDHRVENIESAGVPHEWSAPSGGRGVVRVKPRAALAFQWARARARTARSITAVSRS